MPTWPRFPNAPITEALLDIRAKLPPQIDLARLATLHEVVKDFYPNRRERFSWRGSLQLSPGGPELLEKAGGPIGYLFTSHDGRQIVQARLDGFTSNRLKPYDTWVSFRDEARKQWERYCQTAMPQLTTRIALRYINRIEVPLPIKDFREYILTSPEIAPDLPQGLATFFMRLVIPNPRLDCAAIVIVTMDKPSEAVLPLVLDIDVFRERSFDPNSADLWNAFEDLREFKNQIFFNSITEKAKELFV